MASVTMGEEMKLSELQCPHHPEETLQLFEHSGTERTRGQDCELCSPEPGTEQVFGESPQHWGCVY